MNIRRKIGLSLALLSLVTGIMMVGVANVISRNVLIDRSEAFLRSILSQNGYNLNLQIASVRKVTEGLYDDIELTYQDGQDADYKRLYMEKIDSMVRIASELSPSKSAYVLFTDSNMDYVWYSDYDFTGVPKRNYSTALLDLKDNVIQEAAWQIDKEGKIVSYRKPIIRRGQVIAIVGNNLDFALVESQLNLARYLDSGYLYLTDDTGTLIYHPKNVTISPVDLSEKDALGIIEGVDKVSGYYQLTNGWYLALSIENDEIYSGLDLLATFTILIILASLAIVLIYSFYVSKKIGEPFVYLTKQVDIVGHGDYEVSLEKAYFDRQDEVGVLTRALDAMIKKQKESFEEIKNYSVNLEQLIQARTEELQKANDALEASVEEVNAQKEALQEANIKLQESLEEVETTRKQLIESEKMASTRYLAIGIAHNLNTPIGNMIAIVSYLDSRIDELNRKLASGKMTRNFMEDFIENYLDGARNIRLSLEASKALIDKLLDLSLINATQNLMYFNGIDAVNRQYEVIKSRNPKVNSVLRILEGEDIMFRGDYDAFNQLMAELLENSFIHGQVNNSQLILSVSLKEDLTERNCYILEYSDNGPGVSEEQIEEIYTPLFTSQLSQRHGLGLSLVLNLVTQQFKGTIKVTSDHGLKFIMRLYES